MSYERNEHKKKEYKKWEENELNLFHSPSSHCTLCHSFCFAISFTFLSASEKLEIFCIQQTELHAQVARFMVDDVQAK